MKKVPEKHKIKTAFSNLGFGLCGKKGQEILCVKNVAKGGQTKPSAKFWLMVTNLG